MSHVVGSLVVPFLWLVFRIQQGNPENGTSKEPMGSQDHVWRKGMQLYGEMITLLRIRNLRLEPYALSKGTICCRGEFY